MQIKQGLDKVNITRQGYRVKPLVVRAQRARARSARIARTLRDPKTLKP